MLSFANNNLANTFMTKQDIANVCPMALRHTPTNPNVSGRYTFANTETVIDDLAKLGWLPVEAKQARAKKNSSGIRSFHMVAFQNPDVYIKKTDADGGETIDAYPRIILTNSHDGFNSFKFMVGLYRCVCSNGLIIATDQMVELNIRHVNYDFDELRLVVATAIKQVPIQTTAINAMQNVTLTVEQKTSLAIAAMRIRKGVAGDGNFYADMDAVQAILVPQRKEDEGDSLWNVYNVLQEYMMRGGYHAKASENGKSRKARALTSVAKSVDFNRDLFKAAYEYVPAEVVA